MRLLLAVAVSLMLAAALVGPFAYADGPSNPTWTRPAEGGEMIQAGGLFAGATSVQVYPTPGATPNGNERAITVCANNGTGQVGAVVCMPTPFGTATPSPCTSPNGQIVPPGQCVTWGGSVKNRYVVVLPTPAGTAALGVTIER